MNENQKTPYDYRDIYYAYNDKNDFTSNFHTMIENHKNDYDPYYVTFTFTDIKAHYEYDDYRTFFKYMFQKINNAVALNAKAFQKSPIMILVPEKDPATHFHGFLLINKQTSDRFDRKCVSDYVQEDNGRTTIVLNTQIINPYPKKMKMENLQNALLKNNKKKMPQLISHRIYATPLSADIQNTAGYCVKKFAASHFEYDDLIIEKRMPPSKTAH